MNNIEIAISLIGLIVLGFMTFGGATWIIGKLDDLQYRKKLQ